MTEYEVSIGNSSEGSIGAVLHVVAENKEAALERVREIISQHTGDCDEVDVKLRGCKPNEYFNVYLSPENITLDDIREAD